MGAGQVAVGQGGVGAVAGQVEGAIGQPLGQWSDHGFGQVEVGGAALVVEAEVDRQGQGFATPGRLDPDGQEHGIEAEDEDGAVLGGKDRIAESTGAGHLAAGHVGRGASTRSSIRPWGQRLVMTARTRAPQSSQRLQRAARRSR